MVPFLARVFRTLKYLLVPPIAPVSDLTAALYGFPAIARLSFSTCFVLSIRNKHSNEINCRRVDRLVSPSWFVAEMTGDRHTQTKTMKTALRPKIFDERSRGVVKMGKCSVFKFILRPCQVLIAYNTLPLSSYHVHDPVRTTSNAFLPRSYYDQSDLTTL